jgi:hypothetical protein
LKLFKRRSKSDFQNEDLDYLYSALSHETRRSIIRNLGQDEVLSFTELMEKSNVRDTGTFGFHLKRTEVLLEKLDDGRYNLSALGKSAYELLKFMEMSDEDKKKLVKPLDNIEEDADVKPHIKGISSLENIKKLLINKERLDKFENITIQNCKEVIIDNDITPDMFKNKILSFTNVKRIFVPKNLYKSVLIRIDQNVKEVETYEGEPPLEALDISKRFTNYAENIVDSLKLEPDTVIINYGLLTLRNLSEEILEKINLKSNYGLLKIPRGLKEQVLLKLQENWGEIQEYD